jgi:hypothetical protein
VGDLLVDAPQLVGLVDVEVFVNVIAQLVLVVAPLGNVLLSLGWATEAKNWLRLFSFLVAIIGRIVGARLLNLFIVFRRKFERLFLLFPKK